MLRSGVWGIGRRNFVVVSAVIAAISGHASAQEQAQAGIEEVVVTARKTAEKLQDVPLQVTAFTEDTIVQEDIWGLRELNNLSPSLNYQGQIGRSGTGRLFFRGLNAGSSTSASSSKGSLFLDGNYFASSGQDIPFDYLERIEAMPGPQSALFGHATFGGAVNFVTKVPTDTFSGRISVDVATDADQNVNLFVGGPIVGDKLLASVFLSYQNWGGPSSWRSPPDILHPTGVAQDSTTTYFGAEKLVFKPSDNLTVTADVRHNFDHDGPFAFGRLPTSAINGQFTYPNGTVVAYPVGNLSYPGVQGAYPLFMGAYYNIPDPTRRTESWRPSLKVEWNVSDYEVTLNYMHDFEWWKEGGETSSYEAFPGSYMGQQKHDTKMEELDLRIASPQHQRFRFAFGATYMNLSLTDNVVTYGLNRCNTICNPTSPAAVFDPIFIPSVPGSNIGSIAGWTGVVQAIPSATPTDSFARYLDRSVFGSINFDLTKKIELDAEARYQPERVTQASLLPGGFLGETTFKSFLPRVTVQYKFNDDVRAYVLYSIGNDPGGFNTSPFIGAAGTNTTVAADQHIPEEKLHNYEAGLKATWLDNRLITNITIYHEDWDNQTTAVAFPLPEVPGSTLGLSLSQGSSKVNGASLEVTAVPIEHVNIHAAVSFTDAYYSHWCSQNEFYLTGIASPGQINCQIVNGHKLESVPPWTGSLSAGYTNHLAGDWDWLVRGTFSYQDGMWDSDMNLIKSPTAYIFDINLGVENNRMNIEAYCSNCSQSTAPYRIIRIADPRMGPSSLTNDTITITPRKPREFGMKTILKF